MQSAAKREVGQHGTSSSFCHLCMALAPVATIQLDRLDSVEPQSQPLGARLRSIGLSAQQSSRPSILRREHVLARHHDSVLAVAVSRRTNHVFSGDQDGLIVAWELNTFSFECELVGHRRPITSMVLSASPIASNHILVTSSRDNTIRIWDVMRMRPVAVLDHMPCCVLDLVLNHARLFAGCIDTRVAVLDLEAVLAPIVANEAALACAPNVPLADVAQFYGRHLGFVHALAVTQSTLFSASGDFTIGVWDLVTMSYERAMQGHTDGVTALSIVSDTYLISGSRDCTIKVWALDSRHLVRSVEVDAAVVCLCVTEWALFVATCDHTIQALDLQTFRAIPRGRVESDNTTLHMCADRQSLFTCGTDNNVQVWRAVFDLSDHSYRLGRSSNCESSRNRLLWPIRSECAPESLTFREVLVRADAVQYVETFAQHEIDYEALLLLNDHDLEQIGVSLGTRRKIVAVVDRIVQRTQLSSNDDDLMHFLQCLVALPTVSSDPLRRADAWNCARLIEQMLMGMGAETRLRQVHHDANPVLIAQFASHLPNTSACKLVYYAHYDVVAAADEQWSSPPFELSGRNGYLYGRGTSDNKGPLAAFIAALKELIVEYGGLSIDVALILDGEAETDSFAGGLPMAVLAAMDWLSQPSAILLANTTWSGQDRPCLNYGTRGVLQMEIEIAGPKLDLHAGVHGGAFHEPMTDMTHVLATLVDSSGRVLIDGFYDEVAPITPDEFHLYRDLDFDIDRYKHEIGIDHLRRNEVPGHLQGRWREPCLSIHSIEGCGRSRAHGSIISSVVRANVSMRLVPNQQIDIIAQLFESHVRCAFNCLNSCNTMSVTLRHQGNWWLGDLKSQAMAAAVHAIDQVWGQQPAMIREGGTLPTIRWLEDTLKAPAVHLAFGQASDQSHLENERIRIKNLLRGRDVFKAFIRSMATRSRGAPETLPPAIVKIRSDPRCLSVVGPDNIVIKQASVDLTDRAAATDDNVPYMTLPVA